MRESLTPSSFKTYTKQRIRKIIEAHVGDRIEMHPAPKSPASRPPDLIEQIRLSLAQLESKRTDASPSKKPTRKTPTIGKKKPQRVRA
jgi:hypothetical protein